MRLAPTAGLVGPIVMATICSSCMTMGVVHRSAGMSPWYARITQVYQSATLGNDLFLQLGVQSHDYPNTRAVVLRVPFKEIGHYRENTSAVRLDVDNLRFQPPHVGYWVEGGMIPADASPIQVEYVDLSSSEALDHHLASLAPGIHVLITLDVHTYQDRLTQPPIPHDGAVPSGAHIVVANRIDGVAGADSHLWSFNEARKRNHAWLLLTPLTVIGDIVTSPIQLLYILGD